MSVTRILYVPWLGRYRVVEAESLWDGSELVTAVEDATGQMVNKHFRVLNVKPPAGGNQPAAGVPEDRDSHSD